MVNSINNPLLTVLELMDICNKAWAELTPEQFADEEYATKVAREARDEYKKRRTQ